MNLVNVAASVPRWRVRLLHREGRI